ncbi:MAG: YbhB/YbcL family Raf kinase inhibitor-like protein [Patescibacteria group bacterium]
MLLTSPSFNHNEKIPPKFTCDGPGINPELHIQNIPDGTVSMVLIMDDPDAVGGKVFTHWLAWNINPKTELIKQESAPPWSIEGQNDAGKIGYTGPCPPAGNPREQRAEQSSYDGKPHRYFFKLYALDCELVLDQSATKSSLKNAMTGHILEQAELIGLYKR